jgi:hypothetical protein
MVVVTHSPRADVEILAGREKLTFNFQEKIMGFPKFI